MKNFVHTLRQKTILLRLTKLKYYERTQKLLYTVARMQVRFQKILMRLKGPISKVKVLRYNRRIRFEFSKQRKLIKLKSSHRKKHKLIKP